MNSWWIHDKIVRKKRKKKTHEEIVEEKYALDSVKKKTPQNNQNQDVSMKIS